MDQDRPDPKSDKPEQVSIPKTSPIRPENTNQPAPKSSPSLTHPHRDTITAPVQPVPEQTEDLTPEQKAQQAIQTLITKMAAVAQEYAEGKINQAQFNAIYRRYSEQRQITERLLERDPHSQAWQSVIQTGHTGFLRSHFESRIISYGIYRLEDGQQIILQGGVRLPTPQLMPVLSKIKRVVEQGHKLGPAWRELKDQNWVFIVPGKLTISVVIFSLEPALVQRKQVEDAQRDFERANEKVLLRGEIDINSLVFPHRALMG